MSIFVGNVSKNVTHQ